MHHALNHTLIVHPTLIDPASGLPLAALGQRRDGTPIWPAIGASPDGDGSDAGPGDSGDGSQSRTFDQAAVDRIVADRLAREKAKFADYDQLKASAEELAQIKEANASDQDKAVKAAATEAEGRVRGELGSQLTRLEVAIEEGLGEHGKKVIAAAKRLVGSSRDELVADAKDYFASAPIAPAGTRAPHLDQGHRGNSGDGKPSVASGRDLWEQRNPKKTTS